MVQKGIVYQILIRSLTNIYEYIRTECTQFLKSLPYVLDCLWVNSQHATEQASLKPWQLKVARSLPGPVHIPRTIVGNNPIAVKDFINQHDFSSIVLKTIESSYIKIDENDATKNIVAYSTEIPADDISNKDGQILSCPIIIQEPIRKVVDVRVTVMGEAVFCHEIRGEKNGSIDWRHYQQPKRIHSHELPDDVKQWCVNLTKAMGLIMGCIDLAYTNEGSYAFFEINPQGQWLATEMNTDQSLSQHLANLLLTGKAETQ